MKKVRRIFLFAVSAFFLATQANAIMYFARPYDPNLQRWLTRDPLGERGGLNLYGFTLNNPNTWVDPYGLSTICFNVGFDTSAQATSDNISKLQHSFKNLSDLMSKCCQKYGVGCGVNVSANYDWNQKSSPNGGIYGNGATVPSISGSQGCIPILVTTLPIQVTWQGQQVNADAITPTSGIIYNIDNSNVGAIAHETGHYAGYDKGDWPADPSHSKDPNNPMYKYDTGGKDPDKCYCQKVSDQAR